MTNSGGAPESGDFELSLFGPGVGECIVVHLGAGDWIVIDSCLDHKTRLPIAVEYLNRLGIDIASAVKRVVVTHWHDDHMKGVSALFEHAGECRVLLLGGTSEKRIPDDRR